MTIRNFDIVYCIDLGSRMSDDLSWIKQLVINSYYYLNNHDWVKNLKDEIRLRIKIISFGDKSIKESRFFNVYERNTLEQEYLQAHLRNLKSVGTSSACDALEALKRAIKCDWITEKKKNHIIFVLTKTAFPSIHDLDDGINALTNEVCEAWYHPNVLESKLSDTWLNKRLLLFAPFANPWTQLYEYDFGEGLGSCGLFGNENMKEEMEFVYDDIIMSYYDPPI